MQGLMVVVMKEEAHRSRAAEQLRDSHSGIKFLMGVDAYNIHALELKAYGKET
jgi:hypothetical protein